MSRSVSERWGDILPPMRKKPSIAIVGAGNLGSALAASLGEAGYEVQEIIYRGGGGSEARAKRLARAMGARATTVEQVRLDADVIWLCVPDRQIGAAARELAQRGEWKAKIALHSSGALGSDELAALKRRGAAVASLHPLMTFVRGALPKLSGVPFAMEGDSRALKVARAIVADLGGEAFAIERRRKAAHHAWGGFTSPLIIAALVTAEEVARLAGQSKVSARRRMLPIVKQTIRNYEMLGAEGAFSGPIIRGDVPTVRKHLAALKKAPAAREVYLALARMAMKSLPVGNKKELKKVLGR
jgi:predicted short-subunit dehydrogenase-like oxidoreductase (DUF2520 family)